MEWYVSNKYCGWLMDHKGTPPPRWTHHLVIFLQGILLLLTVPTVSTMSFRCLQAVPSAKTGPIIINSAPLNENTFRRFRPCSDSFGCSTILSDYWRKVSPQETAKVHPMNPDGNRVKVKFFARFDYFISPRLLYIGSPSVGRLALVVSRNVVPQDTRESVWPLRLCEQYTRWQL